jgi:acetylornithine aminotransferase/acetylornithine/N-succinyldiaminopimelate aminotransferase
MNTRATDIQAADATYVLQTYKRAPVAFARGEGAWLYDVDGQAYLDLISGIGVASLGHAHPGLAKALGEQASTLVHTSNLYHHPLQSALARRLTEISGLSRAFFCNSGTEAIEACLKFARRYWFTRGETTRTGFVAFEHAFHGRTFGSLSATWDEHYREPFQPLVPGVTFVPPDDPAALGAAVSESTAAIIVEAIQGEGGVRPISPALAQAIRDARARTGALVIADEVQCGLGRTGQYFHSQTLGLAPDLMALGKALGGGMPVGAALLSQEVASAISAGDHGTTYGGNLLACRAALVFLEELVDRGLLAHVVEAGRHLERGLAYLKTRHAAIKEVRGAGLMRGLQLDRDATPVVEAALTRRLLVNRTAGTVVRLLPPMNISMRDLDEGLARLDAAFTDACPGERA